MSTIKQLPSDYLIKMTYILIILTVLSRLLPLPYNFTSVGALSLFAGCLVCSYGLASALLYFTDHRCGVRIL